MAPVGRAGRLTIRHTRNDAKGPRACAGLLRCKLRPVGWTVHRYRIVKQKAGGGASNLKAKIGLLPMRIGGTID
jgi:hypothetical protein